MKSLQVYNTSIFILGQLLPILVLKGPKNRDFTANGKERVALEWRWDPPERPGVIPPISSLITVNGGKTTAFCSDCQWPPN